MEEQSTPLRWLHDSLGAIGWPVVVAGAFTVGRYVKGLEHRLEKTETRLEQLFERHLPSIHRALAEVLGHLRSGTR